MQTAFLYIGIALCFIMMISLYRTVFGPTILDRLIGTNAVGSKTTALLIIIGIVFERVDMFTDIAIAYAMLNFIAVLAAAKFYQKRKGLQDQT